MANENILVVAAHPDDEVLGCGGTLARHADDGDHVHVLILADGVGARSGQDEMASADDLAARRAAGHRAAAILGVASLECLDYPDNRLDTVALLEMVRQVEQRVDTHRPSTVYTHRYGDVNVDHQRVHEAVLAACRPQPGHWVKRLLFFEIPSSTEWRPGASLPVFSPQCFSDISMHLPRKLEALAAYSEELRSPPHPRSLEACEHLARWRGASIGVHAAEAFEMGRELF